MNICIPKIEVGIIANLAKEISKLGIPAFACTPDRLPELVEVALKGLSLNSPKRNRS